jgi:hypothetical protein
VRLVLQYLGRDPNAPKARAITALSQRFKTAQ